MPLRWPVNRARIRQGEPAFVSLRACVAPVRSVRSGRWLRVCLYRILCQGSDAGERQGNLPRFKGTSGLTEKVHVIGSWPQPPANYANRPVYVCCLRLSGVHSGDQGPDRRVILRRKNPLLAKFQAAYRRCRQAGVLNALTPPR